jgi:LuxR family maltose regulon positive regulatory protein
MSELKSAAPRPADKLLHTKLMPPRLHSAVISRVDLLSRLDASLTKKLTVLTAPTGSGKTTLVSMWIASRDFPSAWVTLDENDNDPSRFWTYAVSALRTLDPALGKITLSALMTSQQSSFESLLTPLINDLARLKETSALVLEDYHFINSNEINEGLSFFIQHLPESLHLVLITRADPNLPLAILRARDELVELNTTDLRFSVAETEAFLREIAHIGIPPSAVVMLQERTEGWVAGLRLAALSLQNRSTGEAEKVIQTFSGSHRYIADYLIKEVFESQPEDMQNFLLKTCFLKRLTDSLCDAITDAANGAARLEQLERDNLFIVQLEHGGKRVWYRYNPLFAESIQHLARQRLGDGGVRSIFEKASSWYEVHGLYDEAIETALAAKLFERAILLVEKFIEIHDITQWQTLTRWLENIPDELIFRHSAICFSYAQVILYTSDRFAPATTIEIEPFLGAAERTWRAEENHKGVGEVLSFRGIAAWWRGDFQKAFEYAHQSLEEIPEDDVLYRGTSLLIVSYEALNTGRILDAQDKALEARALLGAAQNIYGVLGAIQMLSEIFYWQGELEQAEQLNRQILAEAVGDESMLDDQGIASLNLGKIAHERNDLDQAERFAARALDLGGQRGNEMLQVQANIQLALIYAARNDLQKARALVKSLEARTQNPALLREVQDAHALLSIWANEFTSLEWWLNIIATEKQNVLPVQKEREAFTLARLRLAEGKAIEALEAINGWQADAAEQGRVRSQVEASCLEALAYFGDSDLSKATKSLTGALTLGHEKGFRRLFLDEGPRMAALLRAVSPALPNRTLNLFAATLLHSFSPESLARQDAPPLVEPLSQQELRVLRLLVAGLSNTDIAKELVLSTNTIKTHVKSIYRKLNIRSRDEAREVAKELKLV